MKVDAEKLEAIFHEALSKATESERAAYLEHACAGDAELRRQIGRLLEAHESASDNFLPLPETAPDDQPLLGISTGTVIGRYKLLQQIGEGGFGVVFMAEQEQPVHRRVALKIIKLGMDTRQVTARFEAERQALAMMDHPNIAKVFDAGTTETGRPYFVMELVVGRPITEFCDQNNLSIEQRLKLFIEVCQAVQHAHQKGLIHRDIKPSNVLVARVDDRAHPKIIDFGIAKATQARLTDRTLFTEFAAMVGTPQYMSPEQAESSLDIDTRSDVYSLGVLLYELLTGATPFDPRELRAKAFGEMQRIIREVDPPTPSSRLATLETLASVAATRSTEPRSLGAAVRGEMDWIVMKCLEKNRSRRYDSAAALAADIGHHLANEPVSAGKPSRVHRLAKFVRRNRAAVIATSGLAAALIIGLIGTTIGLISESRRRVTAERERVEAQLNLGMTSQRLVQFPDAERLYNAVLSDRSSHREPKDLQTAARARLLLAWVIALQGRGEEAARLAAEAVAEHRMVFPPGDPNLAYALAVSGHIQRDQLRDLSAAEKFYRESLDTALRQVPPDHWRIGVSYNALANVQFHQKRFAEAEHHYRSAIEHHKLAPSDSIYEPQLFLALVLMKLQRLHEAETLLQSIPSNNGTRIGRGNLFIALYDALNQAEPGKGYDAKRQQWIAAIEDAYFLGPPPTTQPAGGS